MKKLVSLIIASQAVAVYAADTSVIYPDQLKHTSLGQGVCSSGYRPVTKSEAETYRKQIVAKMGKWQITGLADRWVIMGSGYSGTIKRSPSGNTWCYPIHPRSELSTLSPLYVAPGTAEQIKWNLVNNKNDFIKPVSYLAHYMGFAWVGGNRNKYVGEDMEIFRDGNNWKIKGYNGGSCSGYRCGEKSSITVGDFEFVMDTESYRVKGDIVTSDKKLLRTVTSPVLNGTSVPQSMLVSISYNQGTNWSKTNDYSVSESVTLTNTWKSPSVTGGSDTSLSVTIGASQSWGESNGGQTSDTVTVQAQVNVPAYTKMNAKVDLFNASISYPYEFDADISYSLKNYGFMRWSGNGRLDHPKNRPYDTSDFMIGRFAGEEKSIDYQWEHRYIPGVNKKWDWPWMIEQAGLNGMKYWLKKVLRPKKTTLSGHFYADSEFAGAVYFGDEAPYMRPARLAESAQVESLESGRLMASSADTVESNIKATEEDLRQQLEAAGLEDVKVEIKVINQQP